MKLKPQFASTDRDVFLTCYDLNAVKCVEFTSRQLSKIFLSQLIFYFQTSYARLFNIYNLI